MAKHDYSTPTARQTGFARAMRRDMSEPERLLWKALRSSVPLRATHFRRQVPIGPYIVDFCCLSARLVLEVDGGQHFTPMAERYDANRTRTIERQGFRVLRFSTVDIRDDIAAVLETVRHAVDRYTPTPYPSPQGGGQRLSSRSTFETES